MKTMFDETLRNDILRRVDRVSSASQRQWGKMTAEEMLGHLVASAKMAVGELHCESKKLPIRYPPLRQLIVYWLPWPKSSPTAPELMVSEPGAIDDNNPPWVNTSGQLRSRCPAIDPHCAFLHKCGSKASC
jgi:hypothetical protein